jgi:hypothetical protein
MLEYLFTFTLKDQCGSIFTCTPFTLLQFSQKFLGGGGNCFILEISKGRRVETPSLIYPPRDLVQYTLREITGKSALLSGECRLSPVWCSVRIYRQLSPSWMLPALLNIFMKMMNRGMFKIRKHSAIRYPHSVMINKGNSNGFWSKLVIGC